MVFQEKDGCLLFRRRQEMVELCPWGEGIRVRAAENKRFTDHDWALTMPAQKKGVITIGEEAAWLRCGSVKAEITEFGKLTFYSENNEILLKEYYRSWEYGVRGRRSGEWLFLDETTNEKIGARTYHNVGGDNYKICQRFQSDAGERLYGMGQYQQASMNLKGCVLDMEHKNTQASVPFLVSSRGYGLLWNNPAVGKAMFGSNRTEISMESTKQIDYWITAGDTPAAIVEQYCAVTGTVPMMPEFAMGFWQCKLRYQTQEEVLQVAREYYRRGIPVGVMVVDFFHWPHQGDWMFDEKYFPDPAGMIRELNEMGMKLMVSIWPTVDRKSIHYEEMKDRDLLVRVNRGLNVAMDCFGLECFFDATNPEARIYIWEQARENYWKKGVSLFWLDEAEPEFTAADFDHFRYHDGAALECANEYPVGYAKAFYDGMISQGVDNPINLIRCAWAGSQRYGALVWSGDVPSTFTYLRYQLTAGLNMGMAGIAWWTADIGGFHGGDIRDPRFHELLMRWFQFGTFCPVMRLHGDRDPHHEPLDPDANYGGGIVSSGADNEVWSYPKEVEDMMVYYIRLRENMRPYIREIMAEAHEKGTPVMKPLFYDFPEDEKAWEVEDAYLFGHDLLVAPVMYEGQRSRSVYLPQGASWTDSQSGVCYEGGQVITADAPLNRIPLFFKNGRTIFEDMN